MLRSVVLIPLFVCSLLGSAQSGTAFLVQCGSAEEVNKKRIMDEVAQIEPKAVVIFEGSDVWMRFKLPEVGSAFQDLMWRTGLGECRSRAIRLRGSGNGIDPAPESSSGGDTDIEHLPLEQR